MINWPLVVGFALSSSIDNLGVGITYGIRGVHISPSSNLVIAAIAFLFSLGGITFGKWIGIVLPGLLPVVLGSFLLAIIGIRIVLLAIPRKNIPQVNSSSQGDAFTRILQNPETVDYDRSQSISVTEAIILGMALSANAMTNGLGAGLLGLSPLTLSALTAAASFISVSAGVSIGRRASRIKIGPFTVGQFGTLISGIMLLAIAYFALRH